MDSLPIIVDVVVILLVVLITVVAIKKGFLKTVFGLLSSVLVIVIAIFASAPLAGAVGNGTQLDERLESVIQGGISSKVPNAYGEILYYDLDGDGVKDLAFKPENSEECLPYSDIFQGSTLKYLKLENIMRKTAESNLDAEDPDSYITVVHALSRTLTTYIFLTGAFIVISILAKIIFVILTKLLTKATENLYFMHFLDSLLGGVFGFVLGAFIILMILTLLQLMLKLAFMEPVQNFLDKSYVVKFLMDKNFLYTLVTKYVSIDKVKGLFTNK